MAMEIEPDVICLYIGILFNDINGAIYHVFFFLLQKLSSVQK